MADLRIQFDIRVTPRLFRWGLTAILLSAASTELASENVTLTTYYPAPSGVYERMITTGETFLARDTSAVHIGTPSALLDTATIKLDATGRIRTGSTSNDGGIWLDRVGSTGDILVGQRVVSGSNQIGFFTAGAGWDTISISQEGVIRQWPGAYYAFPSPSGAQACQIVNLGGPAVTVCPAADQYATLIAGVYTSRWVVPSAPPADTDTSAGGQMLCCPIPSAAPF